MVVCFQNLLFKKGLHKVILPESKELKETCKQCWLQCLQKKQSFQQTTGLSNLPKSPVIPKNK